MAGMISAGKREIGLARELMQLRLEPMPMISKGEKSEDMGKAPFQPNRQAWDCLISGDW